MRNTSIVFFYDFLSKDKYAVEKEFSMKIKEKLLQVNGFLNQHNLLNISILNEEGIHSIQII